MSYNSVYTPPSVYSIGENAITDYHSSNKSLVRAFDFSGYSFASIEINSNTELIEADTLDSIEIKDYTEQFKKAIDFFYSKGVLYGVIDKEGEFFIYDIYANSNFFSSRDIKIFCEETGFKLLEPFYTGALTTGKMLEIMNSNAEKLDNIFFLPDMYLNDNRFEKATVFTTVLHTKPLPKVIVPAKVEVTPVKIGATQATTMPSSIEPPAFIEDVTVDLFDEISFSDSPKEYIKKYSTKKERTESWNTLRANVDKYVNANVSSRGRDWYKSKSGKKYAYYLSVFEIREIMFSVFMEIANNWAQWYTAEMSADNFALILEDLIGLNFIGSNNVTNDDDIYFPIVFKEEINALYNEYYNEYIALNEGDIENVQ